MLHAHDLKKAIIIAGPTACGKTNIVLELAQKLPIEIISVDSAMIYKGMDIGTGKPTHSELLLAPHKLIDIIDPTESYSVARFCSDAATCMQEAINNKKIPVLVGGTMMYFNALLHGINSMPSVNMAVRQEVEEGAAKHGWQYMHGKLAAIDPSAANRIHPNDKQRIQRALEVCYSGEESMTSTWEQEKVNYVNDWKFKKLLIMPDERSTIHANIETRFEQMLKSGFVEEVREIYKNDVVHKDLPSMRSVGYRQVCEFLDDNIDHKVMKDKAIAATRQLAKRQITWIRKMNFDDRYNCFSKEIEDKIREYYSQI